MRPEASPFDSISIAQSGQLIADSSADIFLLKIGMPATIRVFFGKGEEARDFDRSALVWFWRRIAKTIPAAERP
jgi:hypothetical protein